MIAGGFAHAGELSGIGEESGDALGEVLVVGDDAGLAVLHDVLRASVACDDCGNSAGEGFEDDVAEGVGVGREDEEVHVGVGLGERTAAEDAGEVGMLELGAERRFLAALTDDEETDPF